MSCGRSGSSRSIESSSRSRSRLGVVRDRDDGEAAHADFPRLQRRAPRASRAPRAPTTGALRRRARRPRPVRVAPVPAPGAEARPRGRLGRPPRPTSAASPSVSRNGARSATTAGVPRSAASSGVKPKPSSREAQATASAAGVERLERRVVHAPEKQRAPAPPRRLPRVACRRPRTPAARAGRALARALCASSEQLRAVFGARARPRPTRSPAPPRPAAIPRAPGPAGTREDRDHPFGVEPPLRDRLLAHRLRDRDHPGCPLCEPPRASQPVPQALVSAVVGGPVLEGEVVQRQHERHSGRDREWGRRGSPSHVAAARGAIEPRATDGRRGGAAHAPAGHRLEAVLRVQPPQLGQQPLQVHGDAASGARRSEAAGVHGDTHGGGSLPAP